MKSTGRIALWIVVIALLAGAPDTGRAEHRKSQQPDRTSAKEKSATPPAEGICGIVQDEIHRAQVDERSRISAAPASVVSYSTPPWWRYAFAGVVPPCIGVALFFILRRRNRVTGPQALEIGTEAGPSPETAQEFSWDGVLQEQIETVEVRDPLPTQSEEATDEDGRIVDLAKQYHTGQGEVLLALNLLSHKHGKTGGGHATIDAMIDQNESPDKIARTLRRVQGEVEFAANVRKHQQALQRSVA